MLAISGGIYRGVLGRFVAPPTPPTQGNRVLSEEDFE